MARKPMKLKKTEREQLAECEEITRLYEFEGYDRVLERLNAVEGLEPPVFAETDGWHTLTIAGLEARSAVRGKPLLDNWSAAARRALREAA